MSWEEDLETILQIFNFDKSHQIHQVELIDDEDVETMVALYFQNRSHQTNLIQLFAEQSTVHNIDIDLNAPHVFENFNLSPHLQIHPVVIETDVDGVDGYGNNGLSDHVVEDYSDPDLNEVSDDIDDEGANDDGNVNASSIGNSS
ncbi:hypothetical protein J1N35_010400 [Gossypium stocksii]|uniref:Uncharacterized protein n=1 Tax=Gossypium stocksii TaxID=47602 RepID=A0A9D4AAH6_9ROSI|nr:hypothetical protein J1N35_010400 [Gossypium stocksii]